MCSDGIRTVICVILTKLEPDLFGINVCMYVRTNEMHELRINARSICNMKSSIYNLNSTYVVVFYIYIYNYVYTLPF
jgi:hypothetical protein